jgi:cytochrome c-type biogenesis protein CcmE
MNEQSKRRLFLVGALVAVGVSLGVIASGSIGEELIYYWDPTQLADAGDDAIGADVRLAGVVVTGSKQWEESSQTLRFDVSDTRHTVSVISHGNPPQMFREGIGVVVEGTMTEGGVFESQRLMVKHSNEYRAPEEGMASQELYETLEEL